MGNPKKKNSAQKDNITNNGNKQPENIRYKNKNSFDKNSEQYNNNEILDISEYQKLKQELEKTIDEKTKLAKQDEKHRFWARLATLIATFASILVIVQCITQYKIDIIRWGYEKRERAIDNNLIDIIGKNTELKDNLEKQKLYFQFRIDSIQKCNNSLIKKLKLNNYEKDKNIQILNRIIKEYETHITSLENRIEDLNNFNNALKQSITDKLKMVLLETYLLNDDSILNTVLNQLKKRYFPTNKDEFEFNIVFDHDNESLKILNKLQRIFKDIFNEFNENSIEKNSLNFPGKLNFSGNMRTAKKRNSSICISYRAIQTIKVKYLKHTSEVTLYAEDVSVYKYKRNGERDLLEVQVSNTGYFIREEFLNYSKALIHK